MVDSPEQASSGRCPRIRWFSNKTSFRNRLVDRLARLTHGRVNSPFVRSRAAFYREKDAEKNAQSRPVENQHVATWAIWAVEAYTPANVNSLLCGLEALSPGGRNLDQNPAAWLREQRSHAGSSFYVHLANPGSRFLAPGFEVELPSFAHAAEGTIWTATPSLTVFAVLFILNDHERYRFDHILHADHPTRVEPAGPHKLNVHPPENERKRIINEVRAEWAQAASAWFGRYFPGLLTRQRESVATCELSIPEELVPFPARGRSGQDYMTLIALGMNQAMDVFDISSRAYPGLCFAPFLQAEDESRRHSIMAMTKGASESQNVNAFGAVEVCFLYAFDQAFRNIVAQWAIVRVLEHYRHSVAAVRDFLADVVGGRSTIRAIARVRRDTAEGADAALVARDIQDSITDHSLIPDHGNLVLRRTYEVEPERPLDTILLTILVSRADRLIRDVSDLDATLHAQAALLSAHANLRLQRPIIVLAIVSAVAGTIAAIAAIPPARDLVESVIAGPKTIAGNKAPMAAPNAASGTPTSVSSPEDSHH